MGNEILFRLLTLLLLASFIAHRGYYTRQLNDAAAEAASARKKTGIYRSANLLFLLAFISTAVYLIYPMWITWASLSLPVWLCWGGVGLALLGFVLLQWAQYVLGENWSDTPRLMEDQFQVSSGPYRWIRHPVYTAFLLILGSTLIITANWFIGLTWIGSTSLDVMWRAEIEEQMMVERFGDQYRELMRKTGRFIPRLMQ